MRVLMFGWEFPPFKSGGLGTACYDLTKGLANIGTEVVFVMPNAPDSANAQFVKLVGANNFLKNVKLKPIKSMLSPYQTYDQYEREYKILAAKASGKNPEEIYGTDLFEEVYRYSKAAELIAEQEPHDVIHAHDWMAYEAAYLAKKKSGKPVVVHIHATEYDRTGGNPNEFIRDREKWGLEMADKVIANSNFTKQNVIKHYSIPESKISVVHWGIDQGNPDYSAQQSSPFKGKEKMVLFLGRVTIQKGPDYFVEAANKAIGFYPNVKFMVAGNGDMLQRMIDRTVELGIADKFIFTGFLKGADVHKAFKMADLYVMPSVSEPFGLVALESIRNGTPIIISKQSGASEVLTNALKVDFWDVDEMANKIVNVLKYDDLHGELKDNSSREAQKFNLEEPAKKCFDAYMKVIA